MDAAAVGEFGISCGYAATYYWLGCVYGAWTSGEDVGYDSYLAGPEYVAGADVL